MMQLPFYIYSRILPVLISKCRIKFNHYKMWIYSIIVFYNTLKHNRIILYNIWYLQHDATTIYIPVYSQCWFQNAVLNLITTRRECTLLQYSTTSQTESHHSVSYLISATWWTYRSIWYSLISACRIEFNLYKMWITPL